MDWAHWLRDFAVFGVVAAGLFAWLRAAHGRRLLGRVADAVARWSPRRALVIVLLATAATRTAAMTTFEPRYKADTKEYVEKAEAIADEGSPRRQEVADDGTIFYRPLGSSLVLAGWYRLTGTRGLLSARVHGVLLACAAAWLVVVLGRTVGRETEGRLAALAYAAFLPHVYFATIPYTETLVTVLVLAISIQFERLRTDVGGWRAALALGLCAGWLVITRTELAWIVLLTSALLAWERRRELSEAVAPIALSLAMCAVPFVVNHELRAGYPGHLRTSCQGGLILYFGNNATAVNGFGNATPPVAAEVRALYQRDPTGGLARDTAIAWMREHPFQVVANAPKKAFHLWLAEPQGFGWHAGVERPPSPTGMDATLSRVLRSAAYVQSLLLLIVAAAGWRLLGRERRFWTWTLALHLGVWCLLASSTRNRYPLEPWLLLAAAAWVARPPAIAARRVAAS